MKKVHPVFVRYEDYEKYYKKRDPKPLTCSDSNMMICTSHRNLFPEPMSHEEVVQRYKELGIQKIIVVEYENREPATF